MTQVNWRTRLTSTLAITALAITGLVSMTSPALAARDRGPGVWWSSPGGNRRWMGVENGPKRPDMSHPNYCMNMWLNDPDDETDATSITTLSKSKQWGPNETDLTTPQVAWLLSKYDQSKDNTVQAALSMLIHSNYEDPAANHQDPAESVAIMIAANKQQHPQVWQTAVKFADEARRSAAVGYSHGIVKQDTQRVGKVKDIAAYLENGQPLPGIKTRLVMHGPAVWDKTGTNTIDTLTTSKPLEFSWHATGNGKVSYTRIFDKLGRKTLTRYSTVGDFDQDVLSISARPASDPETDTYNSPEWNVIYDFQPIAISKAQKPELGSGTLTDQVEVKPDQSYGDGKWMQVDGKSLPVVYTGTVYELPDNGKTADSKSAKPVGHATFTATAPGTHTASVKVSKPGIYTWVWEVKKSEQGENTAYIHADWKDGFALQAETVVIPHVARIESDRNIIQVMNNSNSKTYIHDVITQSGFPADHPRPGISTLTGTDTQTVSHMLYCVKGKVSEGVTKTLKPVWESTTPASNGKFKIADMVSQPGLHIQDIDCRGRLIFVSAFAGDQRVLPLRTSDLDSRESYTPKPPTLHTTAMDGVDGDKYLPATGKITIKDVVAYHELAAGKEYTITATLMDKTTGKPFMSNGKPITASKKFTPSSKEGETFITATLDAALLLGRPTVVFERLDRPGHEPIIHADINDEGQTVYFPSMHTTATDKQDGDKDIEINTHAVINDAVAYKGLQPGTTYTLIGTVIDKSTSKPVKGTKPQTVSFKANAKGEGSVTVALPVPKGGISKDTQLVAFEVLKHNGHTVLVHNDINDKGQTVNAHIPPTPPLAQTGAIALNVALIAFVMIAVGGAMIYTHKKA